MNSRLSFLKTKFARINNLDLYSIEDTKYHISIEEDTPEDLMDAMRRETSNTNTPIRMTENEQRFLEEDMVIQNKKKDQILDEVIDTIAEVKVNASQINTGVMRNKFKLAELKKTMHDIKDKVDSNNQNMNNIIKKINADGTCLFKMIGVIILILLIMIILRFLGVLP